MISHFRNIALALCLITLLSCNRFEHDLYSKIDKGQLQSIENKSPIRFDLTTITDFEWDSVLIITGNESMPVLDFEIEEYLKRPTEDLETFRDRFYFLTADKKLVIKEVKSGIYRNPAVQYEFCKSDSSDFRIWLSYEECQFTLIPNSTKPGKGTVYLFPKCETKFDMNNFGIFRK